MQLLLERSGGGPNCRPKTSGRWYMARLIAKSRYSLKQEQKKKLGLNGNIYLTGQILCNEASKVVSTKKEKKMADSH